MNAIANTATAGGMHIMNTHGSLGALGIQMLYTQGITFHTLTGAVTADAAFSSERMRIDNSGNVGIGTTAPGKRLEVWFPQTSTQTIGDAPGLQITGRTPTVGDRSEINFKSYFGQTYGSVSLGYVHDNTASNETGGLFFATKLGVAVGDRPLERMRISSAGNVGIGTASPGTKLEVNGTVTATEFVGGGAGLGINGLMSMQAFSSAGNHTWTKPAGVRIVKVYVTGGGGGGGSHNGDDSQGGGGGGGTAMEVIDVSGVSTVSVTVGVGGTGACGNCSNCGTNGGNSTFGAYCYATGGGDPATWGVGGRGGIGVNGTVNTMGGDGGTGMIDDVLAHPVGGTGGNSFWGGGGTGVTPWGVPLAGSNGGGGGGGAIRVNCGANGGSGLVVVEEYGYAG